MVTQGPMLVMVQLLVVFEEKEPQPHLAEGLAGAVTCQQRCYLFKRVIDGHSTLSSNAVCGFVSCAD